MSCEHIDDLTAELALGIVLGRPRATALAHLDRCVTCRRQLDECTTVAETLLTLIPEAEPPAGFTSRVAARLRRGRRRRHRTRPASWP